MRPSLTIVVSVTADANNFSSKSERSVVFRFRVEVGRYIENIVDISPISTYRYRYRIGTSDIGFFDISISYR